MRKYDRKYNIVYLTENMINGKIYVGVHKTDNIEDGYLGSGIIILNAIKKYGKENFNRTIIKFCDTYAEALSLEKEIVTLEFTKDASNYNLAVGGCHYAYPSGSMIEKIRRAQILRYSNKDERLKISKKLKEKWENDSEFVEKMMKMLRSESRCTKISIAHSEWIKNNPELHMEQMMKMNTDPEKIRKTAEAHRGMKRSEESKERMSKARIANFEKMTDEEHDKCCGRNGIYIHDIITNEIKRWPKEEDIPDGWAKGSGAKPEDFGAKQKKWRAHSIKAYHKVTGQIRYYMSEDTVPDDFIIGERPYELSPQYKNKVAKIDKWPDGFRLITHTKTGKKKRLSKIDDVPDGWTTMTMRAEAKKKAKKKWKPGSRIRIHNKSTLCEKLHPKTEALPDGWEIGALKNRMEEYYG